ncbi:hypothetical protein KL905_000594 [Ogataea polymorpha]|uniref:Uncharacterized protein n=1 Tax=Ogataea polymorpha TaxID=460523 RepID=A0A9P8TG83_9ASCO|nr:hypothetical protein KL907_001573 [Ogataea polymorpha]KAG7911200.1 hypothetical protein KL906_001580 [Ogataea polymorpha]KAG7918254.1 hypothetical protein KL927_001711 [Ogataea polymorpha]KAG7923376.1 hypothetical protein KL905_000594 [Ogataea polymorpha]KAH3677480.1 hypothetical protein OGATHE_000954 [Ogataea polymorpha]
MLRTQSIVFVRFSSIGVSRNAARNEFVPVCFPLPKYISRYVDFARLKFNSKSPLTDAFWDHKLQILTRPDSSLIPQQARRIKPPTKFTDATALENYVTYLTCARPSPKESPTVLNILYHEVLKDENLPLLTDHTVDKLLSFLHSYNHCATMLNLIFNMAPSVGIEPRMKWVNLVLNSAIYLDKQSKERIVDTCVDKIIEYDLDPTLATWTSLLMLLPKESAKEYLHSMLQAKIPLQRSIWQVLKIQENELRTSQQAIEFLRQYPDSFCQLWGSIHPVNYIRIYSFYYNLDCLIKSVDVFQMRRPLKFSHLQQLIVQPAHKGEMYKSVSMLEYFHSKCPISLSKRKLVYNKLLKLHLRSLGSHENYYTVLKFLYHNSQQHEAFRNMIQIALKHRNAEHLYPEMIRPCPELSNDIISNLTWTQPITKLEDNTVSYQKYARLFI